MDSLKVPIRRFHARTTLHPWLVFTGGSILYTAISLGIYFQYGSGEDLAIFAQAIRNVAHGNPPDSLIKGPHSNLLGDHWHPLIFALAPLFWIWDDPAVLLVAQSILVSLGFGVFAVCLHRLGKRFSIFPMALVVSPGVSVAMVSDFHEVAIGVPLLALSCSAFVDRNWTRCFWWSIPLLLMKEDAGLIDLGLAVALWLRGQRTRGVVLAFISLVWMYLATHIFIPAMNSSGLYTYTQTSGATGNIGVILKTLSRSLIWPGTATITAVAMIAVVGGISLRSPLIFVAFIPWVVRASVPNWHYWVLNYHYSILPQFALFFAAVDSRRSGPSAISKLLVRICFLGSIIFLSIISATRMIGTHAEGARIAVMHVPRHSSVMTTPKISSHLIVQDDVTLMVPGVDPFEAGQPTQYMQFALLDMHDIDIRLFKSKWLREWHEYWSGDGYIILIKPRK